MQSVQACAVDSREPCIARGEEWHQTNTLDGQKAHDSFVRIGEPEYFQEFGPSNFHVTVGFANPAIINARKASVCGGNDPYLPNQGNCVGRYADPGSRHPSAVAPTVSKRISTKKKQELNETSSGIRKQRPIA